MKTKNDILKLIKQLVNESAPNSEVYLYGSHARGDATETSDWDLLILLNSTKNSFKFETTLMDAFYNLELRTGEIFSPLIYSKDNWQKNYPITALYDNIQKEGIRIK